MSENLIELTLDQIDEYLEALLANSWELSKEAGILFEHGCYARTYTLAHLAREEVGKAHMLQATGARILLGINVDWKKLRKRLTDHKQKLIQEALDVAMNAFIAGEDASGESIMDSAGSAAKARNRWKNDSLYVSFTADKAIAPFHIITREKAERTLRLSEIAVVSLGSSLKKLGPYGKREIHRQEIPDLEKMSGEEMKVYFQALAKLIATHMGPSQGLA